jgi:phosphoribosylaminoimidazole carboxylase (NCAIR synthetase)
VCLSAFLRLLQYEQHLRAVLGWPLGQTSLVVGAAIMVNVLGEAAGEEGMRRAHEMMARGYRVRRQAHGQTDRLAGETLNSLLSLAV